MHLSVAVEIDDASAKDDLTANGLRG